MDAKEKQARLNSCQTNNALGLFLLLFGLVVIISIYASETFKEKATSLLSGGVLLLIGGGMSWNARRLIKKYGLNKTESTKNDA